MNNRFSASVLPALLLLIALALPVGDAVAQSSKSVAGTYTIVKVDQFGDHARGQMILGHDGRYSIILARATLAKVASGSRVTGTAEENKTVVGGSIAHFGKYTVDAKDKTITFNVETSTFPNWDGATFKRPLRISGDQLTYVNNAPSGGGSPSDVVWKRIK